MGEFSIWHWLIVGMFIAVLVWAVRASRRAAANAPAGPNGLKPYGASGWLSLFLLGSILIGPLYLLGQTSSAISTAESTNPALRGLDGWQSYKTFSWLAATAIVLWYWRMSYGLINRYVPSSATRVKYTLLLMPIVTVTADVVAAKAFLNVDVVGESIVDFVRAMFQSLIWFAYFVFSQRVRNTYYAGRKDISWSYSSQPAEPGGSPAEARPAASAAPAAPAGMPQPTPRPTHSVSPEPFPARANPSLEDRLEQLRTLRDKGLISADDFERKKNELLRQL